jgi:hypothetical protein
VQDGARETVTPAISPPSLIHAEPMRFVDAEGRTWTVRDVALLPERTMVEPGHPEAVERYFENVMNERRVYHFSRGEPRGARPDQLERQLRGAQVQRVSDPNLFKV